ncbi:MAG: metallophosphoesterase [Chloroflexota bacterium]
MKLVNQIKRWIAWLSLALFLAACRAPAQGALRAVTQAADPAALTAPAAAAQPPTTDQPAAPSPAPPTPAPPTLTPTPAPSPTPAPLRFAVIGDFGEGNQGELDVSNLVKSWAPDFIITVGDNNYPSGAPETIDAHIGQYYQEYIFPYQGAYGPGGAVNRFFPTLGNHDWDTNRAQAHLDYFSLPENERYYDFVAGPVHFFAVSADSREPDGVSPISAQAQWLQSGLSASTTPWQIVYFHQPPYSSGHHGSVDWMRWPFAAWGADATLGGHDHTYERLQVDGIPYFVNGLGGGPIYDFGAVLPESQARYNSDYGAMLVQATPLQVVFQFITRSGEVIDSWTIQK